MGDGSDIKSTGCSSIRPGFNAWHPHDSSQLSRTPFPRGSDTFFWPLTHLAHIRTDKIVTHTQKSNSINKQNLFAKKWKSLQKYGLLVSVKYQNIIGHFELKMLICSELNGRSDDSPQAESN